MMNYVVCWTDDEDRNRWAACESRRDVAALLIKEGLKDADEEDVVIFTPDAEEYTMTPEDIFASI